jgi:hypothetical protein
MKTRFIELTLVDGVKIRMNPAMIGHYYSDKYDDKIRGVWVEKIVTRVGCMTHNNSGFAVTETCEQIDNLIKAVNDSI